MLENGRRVLRKTTIGIWIHHSGVSAVYLTQYFYDYHGKVVVVVVVAVVVVVDAVVAVAVAVVDGGRGGVLRDDGLH